MNSISRFDPSKAQKAHGGTILPSVVFPTGLLAPFDHAWGYLNGQGMMEPHTHHTSMENRLIMFGSRGD